MPRVIKNWQYANLISVYPKSYIENGYGRRYCFLGHIAYWFEAFDSYGLKPHIIEPRFKNFIGNHYLDGAHTHSHKDYAPSGFDHVRCNLMVKKPLLGGNPILDDEEFNVEVNDMWLCIASREEHKTTPIKGGERLIVSYGALVEKSQIDSIVQNI